MPKKTKAEVNYTPKAKVHTERCGLCAHFEKVYTNECDLVKGFISFEGWCKLFERAE